MTTSATAPRCTNSPVQQLQSLVRLLAREAARADFATRCNADDREAGNA